MWKLVILTLGFWAMIIATHWLKIEEKKVSQKRLMLIYEVCESGNGIFDGNKITCK